MGRARGKYPNIFFMFKKKFQNLNLCVEVKAGEYLPLTDGTYQNFSSNLRAGGKFVKFLASSSTRGRSAAGGPRAAC